MNAVIGVNLGLLVVALLSVLVMIDRMGRGTRGSMRWGAALFLVGILAEMLGYVQHWAAWTDTLFFGGCAACFAANLRFANGASGPYGKWTAEQRRASELKADRYAYLVVAVTALGLLLAWAGG